MFDRNHCIDQLRLIGLCKLSVSESDPPESCWWFQALTKELDSHSGLKAAVITAGIRLELLSESDGGSVSESVRESEDSDWDQSSIQSRLRQIELDWSSLLLDLPVVLQQLHKVRDCLSACLSV